jgi:hypothetical protein
MTLSIAEQVKANRNLLLNLPCHCSFAEVWNPETLSYDLRCIYEAVDRGTEILRAS